MAYVEHPDLSRRLGFASYADDTPRSEADDEPAQIANDGLGPLCRYTLSLHGEIHVCHR